MDYESMSDFEINEAVFDHVFKDQGGGPDYEKSDSSALILVGVVTRLGCHGEPEEQIEKYGEIDYCNNPSDAWPIITENRIGLHPNDDGSYKAFTCMIGLDYYDREEDHYNPLRAV